MAEAFWSELLARRPQQDVVLSGATGSWTAAAMRDELHALQQRLADSRVVAVLADNGPAWVLAELACQDAGRVHLPLPAFFTAAQLQHALNASGADTVITDQPERIGALDLGFCLTGQWQGLHWMRRVVAPAELPAGTAKISFTSGSTGAPKGVCLSAAGLRDTAAAVVERLHELPLTRHLAALPLALLLENVAGIHAPLLRGMPIHLPPLASLGWQGAAGFDPAALDRQVRDSTAASLILVPELLKAWTAWLTATGQRASPALQFVAVGGARVAPALIEHARALGIPAYQGYGLTEAGSVVCLNRPGDDGDGCGAALAHAALRCADGEVRVRTRAFLGYAGQAAPQEAEFATGDLGHLDERGHLHLDGRRGNLLVTSFGRNVSPEWIESALLADPRVMQAVVSGDGRPALAALLVPAPGADAAALGGLVERVNAGLPDYARVAHWAAVAPFTAANGLATGNGRPVRARIAAAHAHTLAALYGAADDATPFTDKETEMSFYEHLQHATAVDRQHVVGAPIVADCLQGKVSRAAYLAFLTQAYHHVRHTTPLLMALGGRLPERLAWMRPAVAEYIAEEIGHEEWILNDIAAAGGDADAVRASRPELPAELMVAYAWDIINRGNPAAFFGMVFVLEGTSVALALTAADRIQQALGLPDAAFSYLRSHGTLDQEHTQHLARLLERMTPQDQAEVLHAARVFFKLYGDIFRALPAAAAETEAEAVPCN
ncbi:AMP-binding protein [Thauera sp. CAU 1555]|uniref:AMP-binding protein n=1 Tax=Thauera sedimentorum TaxID=2767595 RepID=A0ABR9BAD2_9RHOO|nr:AMP-binding protein [Thauera sedimentorum]MBD8503298.1 AMP-binding protein [Thauera sedimentorum]